MTDYAKLKKTVAANRADNRKTLATARQSIGEGAKKARALSKFFERSATEIDTQAKKMESKLDAWTKAADDIVAAQGRLAAAKKAGDSSAVTKFETRIMALEIAAKSHQGVAQVAFERILTLTERLDDRMAELDAVTA